MFIVSGLYFLRYVPSIPKVSRSFIMKACQLELLCGLCPSVCLYAVLIDWFTYVEQNLPFWGEAHLGIMYNPSNVLLNFVCKYYVKIFCMCYHQINCSVVFCCFFILVLVLRLRWLHRMRLVGLLHFLFYGTSWKELICDLPQMFKEFSSEHSRPWAFLQGQV